MMEMVRGKEVVVVAQGEPSGMCWEEGHRRGDGDATIGGVEGMAMEMKMSQERSETPQKNFQLHFIPLPPPTFRETRAKRGGGKGGGMHMSMRT